MSATTNHTKADSALPTTAKVPSRLSGERPTTGIPFTRLVHAELRKMMDTRAGRWLLISIAAVIAIVLVVMFFVDGGKHTYEQLFNFTIGPISYLLPVVGILSVTSEYSQRTALVTYGLEPHRARVTWAKFTAAIVTGLSAVVVALVLGAVAHLATVTFRGVDASWSVSGGVLLGAVLYSVISLAMGVAFGMLFRNSPAAIVVFFVMPLVFQILGGLVKGLETATKWLNPQSAMSPLSTGTLTGEQWAQLGTCVAVWVVVPLLIGSVLLNRSEVK
jgi:ABC-type transport system involved in multi-copper enzyme maturation permease subunit